jgi:hypothetical protein
MGFVRGFKWQFLADTRFKRVPAGVLGFFFGLGSVSIKPSQFCEGFFYGLVSVYIKPSQM